MANTRVIITERIFPVPLDDSDEHRYIDCDRYDKCLDLADKKRWRSFSCQKCPRFKEYKKKKRINEKNKILI